MRKKDGVTFHRVPYFADGAEIERAVEAKVLSLGSRIRARRLSRDANASSSRRSSSRRRPHDDVGILPDNPLISFDLVNRLLTKKEITNVIDQVYRHCGQKETVIFCDRVMALGFAQACKAGISFGKDDLIIPAAKEKLVEDARTK